MCFSLANKSIRIEELAAYKIESKIGGLMPLQFIVKLMPLLLLYIREMSSRIPYIHSEIEI